MDRQKMVETVDATLNRINPGLHGGWRIEAECVVDDLLPLLGDDDAEFHVRRDAPDTSKAIVESIRKGSLQEEMLGYFIRGTVNAMSTGYTDDEMEVAMHRSHQSVSATRNTLVRKGYLVDSGARRRNRWNNEAIVWIWTGKQP